MFFLIKSKKKVCCFKKKHYFCIVKSVVDNSCLSSGKRLEKKMFDGLRGGSRLAGQTVDSYRYGRKTCVYFALNKAARFMTVALCVALMLASASCGKHYDENDIGDENEIEDVKLLERFNRSGYHNNSTYTLYEYDAQRRITKRSVYYYPEILYYAQTITYNANEIVLGFDSETSITFTQNGNKISFFEGENKSIEIELNAQGLPVKQTSIQVWGSGYWEMQTSTFAWENGNLIQEDWENYREEDGIEDYSIGTVNYIYDAMKSPFYYCTTPKWFLLYWLGVDRCSVNNIETANISQIYSFKDWGRFSNANVQRRANTYNNDGFLATQKDAADTSIHGQSFLYKSIK